MKFRKGRNQVNTDHQPTHAAPESGVTADLGKLKKKDLLEIMLRQGEEIDALREKVAGLEAQLAKREFDFDHIGNIAEASLVVTKVFEEAQEAAVIYLKNVRRIADQAASDQSKTDQAPSGQQAPARGEDDE